MLRYECTALEFREGAWLSDTPEELVLKIEVPSLGTHLVMSLKVERLPTDEFNTTARVTCPAAAGQSFARVRLLTPEVGGAPLLPEMARALLASLPFKCGLLQTFIAKLQLAGELPA